ncbi:MAG: D-tyrosyl-tRNA(Tyr) deacylase [Bacteroidetes bacterium]|jgi:D-aminoacyl-tRNA deacylase|nr:D-tyrosyl-tRNA(Tyr) deacylase [Bacteroidota bacterium]|tara:strand:+ start:221 stop:673 length:453 start_codon:yes stop_codon:yes gene_type:complete
MRAVIQRVSKSSVKVNGNTLGQTSLGLLILLGIEEIDDSKDVAWLAKKVIGLRIFSDEHGKMNLNIEAAGGELLVISQFTLHASTKKGTRPSFIKAARPEQAIPLYQAFIEECEKLMGKSVARGEFGADMQVELINDGPVTITIDTQNKE